MSNLTADNRLRLTGPAPKGGFRGHGVDDGASVKAPGWLLAVVKGEAVISHDDGAPAPAAEPKAQPAPDAEAAEPLSE
jgi:hypothetical protein